MADKITIVRKTPEEIDLAITDGQGIPEGQVWVAEKKLRSFVVACNEVKFITKLRGYPIPLMKFKTVTIWEPLGFKALSKTIEKAWEALYKFN